MFEIVRFPLGRYRKNYNLKLLRPAVCREVLKRVRYSYVQSLKWVSKNDVETKWKVADKDRAEFVFIRSERLVCTCSYLEKTGLPCCHLICVIRDIHEDILTYVDQRWKINYTEVRK